MPTGGCFRGRGWVLLEGGFARSWARHMRSYCLFPWTWWWSCLADANSSRKNRALNSNGGSDWYSPTLIALVLLLNSQTRAPLWSIRRGVHRYLGACRAAHLWGAEGMLDIGTARATCQVGTIRRTTPVLSRRVRWWSTRQKLGPGSSRTSSGLLPPPSSSTLVTGTRTWFMFYGATTELGGKRRSMFNDCLCYLHRPSLESYPIFFLSSNKDRTEAWFYLFITFEWWLCLISYSRIVIRTLARRARLLFFTYRNFLLLVDHNADIENISSSTPF